MEVQAEDTTRYPDFTSKDSETHGTVNLATAKECMHATRLAAYVYLSIHVCMYIYIYT